MTRVAAHNRLRRAERLNATFHFSMGERARSDAIVHMR